MKKFKKIFAGFLSLATLLTCVPFATVSAEENPDPYNFSEYKVVEGELKIAKWESIRIPDSLAIEMIKIENDNQDIVSVEPFFYDYCALGLEEGTATISMYSLYNQTKYVWHVTVAGEYPGIDREKEIVIVDSSKNRKIVTDSNVPITATAAANKYISLNLMYTDDKSIYDGFARWTSEDESVATVSNRGYVTPKGNGTTTITARVGNNVFKCEVTVTKVIVNGDADYNGKVNLYDVIKISKHLLNTTDNSLNEDEFKGADVNGDGKVDLYDVIYICKGLLPGGEFA